MSKRSNKPAVASAMPTVATLPAAPVAAAKPVTVALRGGPAVTSVKLGAKAYRVSAPHNVAWWKTVTDQLAASAGEVAVQDLLKAEVPAIMVGYLIRRGYLTAV